MSTSEPPSTKAEKTNAEFKPTPADGQVPIESLPPSQQHHPSSTSVASNETTSSSLSSSDSTLTTASRINPKSRSLSRGTRKRKRSVNLRYKCKPKTRIPPSTERKTPPFSASLAEFSRKSKNSTNSNKGKSLLCSLLDLFEGKFKPEVREDVPDREAGELSEDQEALQRKRITAHTETIPVYRDKDLESQEDANKSCTPPMKRPSVTSLCSRGGISLEEEDSDGYNSAVHLEHVIADLSAESVSSLTDDHEEDLEDEDRLQFEESTSRSRSYLSSVAEKAKLIFDQRLLGKDENEFDRTRFKCMIRRMIPEQFPIPKARHHSARRPLAKFNCGTCHYAKLSIAFTLLCVIVYYTISDPCLNPRLAVSVKTTTQLTTVQTTVKTNTVPKKDTHLVPHIAAKKKTNSHSRRHQGKWSNEKKHKNVNMRMRSGNESLDNQAQYCAFKKAYVLIMSLALPLLLLLLILYTCRLVVTFHMFAWFLFETFMLLTYFPLLFFASLIALYLEGGTGWKTLINVCVLSDSLLLLLIAMWTYRKYCGDADPFSLISVSNPDADDITQILIRRQISRLFMMGKANQLQMDQRLNDISTVQV